MVKVPLVSIIIRAYNEEKYIGQLLHGIAQQDLTDYEVILVDSGSTDRTVQIAVQFGAKVVTIEKSKFSFGRSLNIGCSAASGKFIVIASGHIYPRYRTWLSEMIKPFDDPGVAVSYGKQRGDHRTKFSENVVFQQWFPQVDSGTQNHYFCNNANSAIRRCDWENNPYDEQLTGLEDLKYAKHFFEEGRQVTYCPEAVVVHIHEETWPRVRSRYMREALALRQIEDQISFNFMKFAALFGMHVIGDSIIAWRQHSLFKNIQSIVLFRYNQYWGTYLGHRRSTAVTDEMKKRFYYPSRRELEGSHPVKKAEEVDYKTMMVPNYPEDG